MRRRSNFEYLRRGFLQKRIYLADGSYEEVKRPFRYKSDGGATQSSGQLMAGFMHTDTSAVIEAITDLPYDKGDKVLLDNKMTYEIVRVDTVSFGEYGRLRNIRKSAFRLELT